MLWDILMGVSSVILAVSLLPQIICNIIYKKCDIILQTSIMTAIPLTVTCISMLALRLPFAGISTLITAGMWWVLIVQRVIY